MKLNIMKYKFLRDTDAVTDNDLKHVKNRRLVLVVLSLIAVLLMLCMAITVAPKFNPRNGGEAPILACYLWIGGTAWEETLQAYTELCTHVLVAFATVNNCSIQLNEETTKALRMARTQLPAHTKLLLSVGGASNTDGFPIMVRDHASRKIFIKSIKSVLREYALDGIDLDWEFPGYRGFNFVKMLQSRREKQHFSQLLREIRQEFIREKRDYLLTVAIAAQQIIAMVAYDVDQINNYVDFANIMSYDYHFFSSYTPFTGFNSPLYERPDESSYLSSLNINFTVNWYVSQGLSRDKIVVGIPTYGHSFTLVNSNNHGVGSPASGYGSFGNFVDYPQVCKYIENNSSAKVEYDKIAQVPYLYNDKEWVSFETPESVEKKAEYIVQQNLRGAMIYSLNADDYKGHCHGNFGNNTIFPLTQAVKNTLHLSLVLI